MAFLDFPDQQYVKTADTSETIGMGGFKASAKMELFYIRAAVYINGVSSLGGSETMQMTIYADNEGTKQLFQSSSINVSDIDGIGSTNWIGLVRFTFARQQINPNITYYPRISLSNYTRSGDTFYIGFPYDYFAPVYSTLASGDTNRVTDHSLAMQIFGYME